jgi:DNA helicase-2/ATP-dependent DNA helicase PcrA
VDGGHTAADVAVFYRTNAQSRVFEEVFIRTGQPYRVVGGVRFYERREIRDALAYLRLLVNPADEVSLDRILNVPKRGIGDRAVAAVRAFAAGNELSFWEALRRSGDVPGLAARSQSSIASFVAMIEELQSMVDAGERPDVVLDSVLERSGYLKWLEDSDDPQDETRRENLGELVAVAREFADDPVAGPSADPADVDAGTVAPGLSDFLERVSLVADTDQIPDDEDGVVTLMTLHTAKGLEFPIVFLTGLEDGVFPHSRSLGNQSELEEERRLAYVGVTRARERLYISRAVVRSAWGAPSHNPGSRFLDELPVDLVDWRRTEAFQTTWERPDLSSQHGGRAGSWGTPTSAGRRNFSSAAARADAASKAKPARDIPSLAPGDRVIHDSFGMGTVVAIEGVDEKQVASIDFGSEGVKRLLLRYAPVEKL